METIIIEQDGRPRGDFPDKPIESPIRIEASNHELIGFFVSIDDFEIVRRFHIARLKETMESVSKKANLSQAQMETLLAKDA